MKIKTTLLTIALGTALGTTAAPKNKPASAGYPITPVPFTAVKVDPASFWGQRFEASRKVTIPLAFSKCEGSTAQRCVRCVESHALLLR